jgi:urocanate hydratase
MGGAQPLAVTMNDGVAICIEVDPSRISRRIEHRYLDEQADSIEDAVARAVRARDERRPLSIGVLGNAAELLPQLLEMKAPIDIVTDQTSAHDPLSYLPIGVSFDDWHDAAARDPGASPRRPRPRWRCTCGPWWSSRTPARRSSTTATRSATRRARAATTGRSSSPGFVPAYIRPLFCEGKGPFRWAALSGDPADIAATDRAILELFPDNERLPEVDHDGRGAGALPGPAGAHLLAGVRRAPPGRAEVQRDGRPRAS